MPVNEQRWGETLSSPNSLRAKLQLDRASPYLIVNDKVAGEKRIVHLVLDAA